MKQTLPSNIKVCATCARWGGERKPLLPSYNRVEFDHLGRGKCYGGAFDRTDRNAMNTCPKWQQQYDKD
ncbi:MAG: hypothetical protein ACI4QI_03055 [Candidatus Coproplasma sp.]